MISNRRYNDLNDKYRKLENEYIYLQRWYKAQSKQYKEQEKILNRIEQINDLYKEKIQKFETERDISKQKINKTERINDILIKRILNYQKILEEKYSDWRVVADNAWRYSKGIKISYEIPDPFIKGWESRVKFDSNFKMIEFFYPDGCGRLLPYKMPVELYHLLGGNILCKVSDRYTPYVEPLFEDEDEVKRILINKGISLKGKFIEELLGFILSRQSSTYSIKEFGVYCGFLNRETRRNYHNKLKKAGMVKEIGKDLYEFVRVDT